jgi:hypothetical protein
MMFCVTQSYGQRNRCCQQTGSKRNALSAGSSRAVLKGEDRCAPTQTAFGVIPGRNYEEIMTEKSAVKKIDGPPL